MLYVFVPAVGFALSDGFALLPAVGVNSTPTNTARTELHSIITFHHANMCGSRAAKLRIAHLCVLKAIAIRVSCLTPCRS